jgi:hypothetical protein
MRTSDAHFGCALRMRAGMGAGDGRVARPVGRRRHATPASRCDGMKRVESDRGARAITHDRRTAAIEAGRCLLGQSLHGRGRSGPPRRASEDGHALCDAGDPVAQVADDLRTATTAHRPGRELGTSRRMDDRRPFALTRAGGGRTSGGCVA